MLKLSDQSAKIQYQNHIKEQQPPTKEIKGMKDDKKLTIEEIEELLGEICDHYCKLPNQLHYEQLMERCEKCPLNTIKEVLEHD